MKLAQLEGLLRERLARRLDEAVRQGKARQALHYAERLARANGHREPQVGPAALVYLVRSVERVVINA